MKKNIKSTNGKKQQTIRKTIIKTEKTAESAKGNRAVKQVKPKKEEKRLQKMNVRRLLQKLETAKNTHKKIAAEENVEYWIGIDLGDRRSRYCFLDKNMNIVAEDSLATTATEFEKYFKAIPRSRIALEVGTHSPWVSSLLEELGHSVIIANPRKTGGGKKKRHRKNDKLDARMLARQVKSDPNLLYPIQHRSESARQSLVLLRARHAAVSARTKLICAVRGLVKSDGKRLPKCSAESFHKMDRKIISEALREALGPLFEQIEHLTEQIKAYDKKVNRMGKEAYPETELLRQVDGVGPVVALAYILTLDNPGRFAKSRDVGPYLGLIPRQYDSGDSQPQMRITKTGDRMMRSLLVQSAQHILGKFGKDSDLRRHGLKIAARGGKNAKKRATTAVARKLAVLLHSLWVTAEVYEPLRNSTPKEVAA